MKLDNNYIADKILCSGQWRDLNINFDRKEYRYCCKNNWKQIKNDYTFATLLNNPEVEKSRYDMLHGLENSDCDMCWEDYRKTGYSWRNIANRWTKNESITYLENYQKNKDLNIVNPSAYVLTFDNICDQSCIYCGPRDSTRWASELNISNFNKNINSKFISEFIKYLNDLYCNDKINGSITIQILGGEPTYSNNFYNFLENMLYTDIGQNEKKCGLNFSITSNLNTNGKKQELFIEYIKKFKNNGWCFHLGISNECTEKIAENVRFGLKWENFNYNIKYLLQNKLIDLFVMSPTINVFVVKNFKNYIEYIYDVIDKYNKDQEATWMGNWVTQPEPLDIINCDPTMNSYIQEAKQMFIDNKHYNTVRSENFIECLDQMQIRIKNGKKNYNKIFEYLDYLKKHKNIDTNLMINQLDYV